MKSTLWKFGVVAVLITLLHCVNEPPSTVHLFLNLKVEEQNDISRVIMETKVPEDYSFYHIVDNQGTLIVSYRKLLLDNGGNLIDSTVVETKQITNDSISSQLGTFNGVWEIPASLSFDSLYPNTPIFFTGSLMDETGHNVSALLVFSKDTTLTTIRQQQD